MTRLHIANAGDARVVLCHDGRPLRLSHDHRTDCSLEVQRIEKSGGMVFKNRVVGILAVSRSLGDHGLKEFVIGTPYIDTFETCHTIRKTSPDTDFVIVACDGLWDVMSDKEAVDLVQKVSVKETAAQVLVDEAVRRKSADNITAIVNWI